MHDGCCNLAFVRCAVLTAFCGSCVNAHSDTTRVTSAVLFSDTFDDVAALASHWIVDFSPSRGTRVSLRKVDEHVSRALMLTSDLQQSDVTIHRAVDFTAMRGKRVRLSVRIQKSAPPTTLAFASLSFDAIGNSESYSDNVETPITSLNSWKVVNAVADVPLSASGGKVSLVLRGPGTALFDDVLVTSLGSTPAVRTMRLSQELKERLVGLTRALSLVRYFHPSDEGAAADWNEFSIRAVNAVLQAPSTPLGDVLRQIFASIAPTAQFFTNKAPILHMERNSKTTHLVRWRHFGLGSDDPANIYLAFRDGIDAEEGAAAYGYAVVALKDVRRCATTEIRMPVKSATGEAWLLAMVSRSARRVAYIKQQIPHGQHELIISGEVPSDAQEIRLGVFLSGRSSIEFENIALKCATGNTARVDAHSIWKFSRYQDLFRQSSIPCNGAACVKLSRVDPDSDFVEARDVVNVDIVSGLHMSLPVAMWTDGRTTFPHAAAVDSSLPSHGMMDLPVRLAAVIATWGTLSWFYPYFDDTGVDWPATLSPALDEAAQASTAEELHRALWHLVAKSRDGHARVRHPTQSKSGMLPLAVRRFGSQVVVEGGLQDYTGSIPVGSELLSIDGVPAQKMYADMSDIAGGATLQAHEYLSSLYMTIGPMGVLRNIGFRAPDGSEGELILPNVSRVTFDEDIHNRRPLSGREITSGVLYVDMAQLNQLVMAQLLKSVSTARALILDMRGYVTDEGYELLAHFVSRPIPSPIFWIPQVFASHTSKMPEEGWVLRPAMPLYNARLIVLTDARAVSASETFVQTVRDHHLATLVGEPTAGTNGDVSSFVVPADFEIRFSGLHVSAPDGSTIQGHGITPDKVVHPTLEGIRAGRDEILEAAVGVAREN